MADVAPALRAYGVVADIGEVIAASRASGLPLAALAAKLKRESYGGRNTIGHDRVDTGGAYAKGGDAGNRAVTEAYLRWRGPAGQHRNRQQGWGPSQLTWAELQDQAESEGGLHVARVNMIVGARELNRCLKAGGGSWREAGARYNGGRAYASSSDAAKEYGRWLEAEVGAVERRLSGLVVPSASTPSPPAGPNRPYLREGDTSELVWRLQRFLVANYGAYSKIDVPTAPPSRLGPQTIAALEQFQQRQQPPIPTAPPFGVGPKTWVALEAAGFRP